MNLAPNPKYSNILSGKIKELIPHSQSVDFDHIVSWLKRLLGQDNLPKNFDLVFRYLTSVR